MGTEQERDNQQLQNAIPKRLDSSWRALGPCCTEETGITYFENQEHLNIYKCTPNRTGNTLRLRYRAQPINAVWGNSRCLL
jgi:hypothetical protein